MAACEAVADGEDKLGWSEVVGRGTADVTTIILILLSGEEA